MKILRNIHLHFIFAYICLYITTSNSELVINVRVNPNADKSLDDVDENDIENALNDDDKIGYISQRVVGNSSTDTVVIEYTEADGSVVTQLTDFRMQSQITRVLLLGEVELGEPIFQELCFVSFYTGDLIPPEAVMKLRQKHPGTIRVADEDLGDVVQDSPLLLRGEAPEKLATYISSHLPSLCRNAQETTFSSQHELYNILSNGGGAKSNPLLSTPSMLQTVSENAVEGYDRLPRCFSLLQPELSKDRDQRQDGVLRMKAGSDACICSKRVWFNWFPCALKYCRNKDGEGEHRCGIKTCRKCMTFRYPVKAKSYCAWDEP